MEWWWDSLYSIIRVEMHNFMTYGDVVFNASPRLNIILGQNGSGKVDMNVIVP